MSTSPSGAIDNSQVIVNRKRYTDGNKWEVFAMTGFDKSMRLKGKAEEDRYFSELDRERITALHAKNSDPLNDQHCREAKRGILDCRTNLASVEPLPIPDHPHSC